MRLSFDIECYINYFLVIFYDDDRVVFSAELYNDEVITEGCPHLEAELRHNAFALTQGELEFTQGVPELISFNGIKYDILMLYAFSKGANNQQLKVLSDRIIVDRMMPWTFERKYKLTVPSVDQIDLIELPAGMHSLKFYGARLRAKKLQELPFIPSTYVMPWMIPHLFKYCINDNKLNFMLFRDQLPQINLRRRMSNETGFDLRSKSDAQIGETLLIASAEQKMGSKLKKVNLKNLPLSFKYTAAPWISFTTPAGQDIFTKVTDAEFKINPKTYKVTLPRELNRQITIGDRKYKFGIGGLHSVNDLGSHYSDGEYEVFQIDVRSYYPMTILNGRFFPPQISEAVFFEVYQGFVDTRNAAKAKLDTLDQSDPANAAEIKDLNAIIKSVKIVLNGFYGKLSSHYSKAYSPSTLVHVTLTGQLSLLMLIEQLAEHKIQVLSANTDGITVRVPKHQVPFVKEQLVPWWETQTGYQMDYDEYKSIHYRDVNNYTTHYTNGKVKGIGIFANESIRHSPSNWIVRDAVFDYIKNGTHPRDTIYGCRDVHLFITLAKVSGSATKDGEPIGKVVRFYKSIATQTPILPANPNKAGIFSKVPTSDNGMPLMDYPEDGTIPADVDRGWYEYETYRTMVKIHLITKYSNAYHLKNNRMYLGDAIDEPEGVIIPFSVFCETIGITKKDRKQYNISVD